MRCLIILLLILSIAAEAQRSSFNLAFGVPYGSAVNAFGITAQAEAFTGEKTALFGQYNLYAPSSESFTTATSTGSVSTNWNELNFNFEYFFLQNKTISMAGLAGISVNTLIIKTEENFNNGVTTFFNDSDTRVGFNIGIVIELFNTKSLFPFVEIKDNINKDNQVVVVTGLKINL